MAKDRPLYIEPSYVFGCLRDAAKYTKKGRGSIQVSMCATVQVEDARSLIQRNGEPLCVSAEPIPTDSE